MLKILKIVSISAPIVIAGGTVGTYFAVAHAHSSKINEYESRDSNFEAKSDIFDGIEIFPKLDKYDFYKFIKMDGPKAIIDKEMQAQIINYIIKHANISDGEVGYKYKESDDQKTFEVNMKWEYSGEKPYRKNYVFQIKQN